MILMLKVGYRKYCAKQKIWGLDGDTNKLVLSID